MDRASHSGTEAAFQPRLLINWAAGVCLAVLAALAIVPLKVLEALPAFCPFRRFFGIECYGCGMTRALCALLHGNTEAAMHFNRGILIVAPMLVLTAILPALIFLVDSLRMAESAREFKLAFVICWLIATTVAAGSALAPYVLTETQIARLVPVCESKAKLGKPCFLCGMTTAFIAIAHGRLQDAEHANRGSLPIYAGFVCNGAVAACFLFRERHRS